MLAELQAGMRVEEIMKSMDERNAKAMGDLSKHCICGDSILSGSATDSAYIPLASRGPETGASGRVSARRATLPSLLRGGTSGWAADFGSTTVEIPDGTLE